MIHTHSARLYDDSAYDKYLSLKPSLSVWLAALFLSREITLPLCMGMAHVAGVNNEALGVMRQLWSFDFTMLPAIPAATLLYLFIRRIPTASRAVRWLWSQGRVLLVISAALDVAAILASMRRTEITDLTLAACTSMAVDVTIVGYSLISQRVRDTFDDFPAAPAP